MRFKSQGTPIQRTWIKLHVNGWLHGSVRWQLTPAERGTLADLFALAGERGRDGEISDNDGRPFPMEYIAHSLNIDVALLESTIAKCVEEGRIVDRDGVITLTNWKIYQSEYDRQKKYRTADRERTPGELAKMEEQNQRTLRLQAEKREVK